MKNGSGEAAANGDAEVTNGHSKEAAKRKADESGDAAEEPIPVSAEKIAKLKEQESAAEDKADEAAAPAEEAAA